MLAVDWIIVVLWMLGVLKGWHRGMVRQAVSLVGLFIGFLLAKAFCSVLGTSLAPESEHPTLVNGVCFVLIWIGVPIVLGILGEITSTALDKLFVIGTFNKMCGAVIGFFKYAFVMGAMVWMLSAIGVIGQQTMEHSRFCSILREVPVWVYNALDSDSEQS